MPSRCPICNYAGDAFKPAGRAKSGSGRRKRRDCPSCGCDEWSRLVADWLGQNQRLPRQPRILGLDIGAALRSHLSNLPGASLVDAETSHLAGGVFAPEGFDLIFVGDNWSYESRDISLAVQLHRSLRPKGWLIARPVDVKDGERKLAQLNQLGFDATPGDGLAREHIAVSAEEPFLAAQKRPDRLPASETTPEANSARLIWYREAGPAPEVRPAPLQRDWMDATPERYAYRCLPLNIANAQGWELLSLNGFTAIWDGGVAKEAIKIAFDDDTQPAVMSHFGSGVLTFSIRGLFRTPPGIDLMVTGPLNRPRGGIQALAGVIETDWSDFGFTMNWLFTDKDRLVRFDKGEPFAALFPIPRTLAESLDPVIIEGEIESELWRRHMAHRLSRADFIEDLKVDDSQARQKGWQRAYFSGPSEPIAPEHRTKVRLKNFRMVEN